jgi:hypothetical protein
MMGFLKQKIKIQEDKSGQDKMALLERTSAGTATVIPATTAWVILMVMVGWL